MTRTYTLYFDEESLAPMVAAYKDLVEDWNRRARFIDDDVALAGARRLRVLAIAIDLLGERVA